MYFQKRSNGLKGKKTIISLLRDSTGEAAHKTVSEQIYEYVKEVSEESF